MTLSERFLAMILGGLILWVIKMAISYFVKRSRLRAALLADITVNTASAEEQNEAVAELLKNHVVVGNKIPFPISYNVGEYLLYKSLQRDLPEYLSKTELVKVVKFYQALWELDVSINGLAWMLGRWEQDGIVLSGEHVAHIKNRKGRIDSFCNILTKKQVRSLNDLPDDYKLVKGPATVFGPKPASVSPAVTPPPASDASENS